NAVKWPIWVMPATKQRLEERFSGRVIVTLLTIMAAIADDSVIFIEGDDAHKLRDMGIINGKQMLVVAEKSKELEEQLAEMNRKLAMLAPLLKEAGVGELV